MNEGRDAAADVAHVVRVCRRGIVCHGEMWGRLFARVPAAGVVEFLDALPADVRSFLREALAAQRESFDGVAVLSAEPGIRAEVERWATSPPSTPGC